MKIDIWSDGDSSVGINGGRATVEIEGFEDWFTGEYEGKEDDIRDYREATRDALIIAFQDIFDDRRVHVLFEDEGFSISANSQCIGGAFIVEDESDEEENVQPI